MKLSLSSSKKYLGRFALVLLVSLMFQGCAMQWGAEIQWNSQSQILMSEDSQVKLRSIQSRVFDTTDRAKILRIAVATMQEETYLKAVIGLEQAERWVEVRQAYTRAADRWPHSGMAWMGLGNSDYALKNLPGAERAFRSAVEEAPQLGAAYNNLAHVLMELRRPEEALEIIDQAIQLGGPLSEVFQKTRSEIQQEMDR